MNTYAAGMALIYFAIFAPLAFAVIVAVDILRDRPRKARESVTRDDVRAARVRAAERRVSAAERDLDAALHAAVGRGIARHAAAERARDAHAAACTDLRAARAFN